jgi:hypothetical protein
MTEPKVDTRFEDAFEKCIENHKLRKNCVEGITWDDGRYQDNPGWTVTYYVNGNKRYFSEVLPGIFEEWS